MHSFNPAEAEEWFRSPLIMDVIINKKVSIQPKPKNGLEAVTGKTATGKATSFNPAEAEEWFRRPPRYYRPRRW